jgi:hypothetical protein
MVDEVDNANDEIARQLEIARMLLKTRPAVMQTAGRCYNCDEIFPAGDLRLFCDSDCEADFRKRQLRGAP